MNGSDGTEESGEESREEMEWCGRFPAADDSSRAFEGRDLDLASSLMLSLSLLFWLRDCVMSHRDAVDVFCFSHHGGARLRDLKRIAGGERESVRLF